MHIGWPNASDMHMKINRFQYIRRKTKNKKKKDFSAVFQKGDINVGEQVSDTEINFLLNKLRGN